MQIRQIYNVNADVRLVFEYFVRYFSFIANIQYLRFTDHISKQFFINKR